MGTGFTTDVHADSHVRGFFSTIGISFLIGSCGASIPSSPSALSDFLQISCPHWHTQFVAQGDSIRCSIKPMIAMYDVVNPAWPDTLSNVRWSSSAPHVIDIDSSGFLVAKSEGRATIHARSGTREGFSYLQVFPPAVGVRIAPRDTVIKVGEELVVNMVAVDANGTRVVDVPLTSSRSNPHDALAPIAHTSPLIVKGNKPGTVELQIYLGYRADTAMIRIVE